MNTIQKTNDQNNILNFISVKAAGAAYINSDGSLGQEIFAFNIDRKVIHASLIKVLVCMVLLDQKVDLKQYIQRTEQDEAKGSGANLKIGDCISIYDALRNLLLPSSNVTANMIARIFGTQELRDTGQSQISVEQARRAWVHLLQEKAQSLGMGHSVFCSPSGLDLLPEDQFACSTTRDLLRMFAATIRYPDLLSAWSQPLHVMRIVRDHKIVKLRIKSTVIPMVELDPYVIGGKTGTLTRYGYNLGQIIELVNGQRIAVAVLGAKNDTDRTYDMRLLTHYILNKLNSN